MSEVWLRAYGGTGGLIARAFIALLLVSPLKDPNKKIVIQLMDYDELPPSNNNSGNDLSILNDVVACYNALHKLGLNGLAVNEIQIIPGQLKNIRSSAYGINETAEQDFNYSLADLFGPDNVKILKSCFKTSQIYDTNKNGAYGDLARNAVIAKPLVASKVFEQTYTTFDDNNTIVMYLGSTDGGVGNTLLDPDLDSLYNYIIGRGWNTDKTRQYRIYSFRTIPYKSFSPEDPDPKKAENAKRILEGMVPQSKGVIRNLETRSDYIRHADMREGESYKLDALFLSGYAVRDRSQFDDTNAPGTNNQAHLDSQTHRSHIVELVTALMMIDCLNGDLNTPVGNGKYIYGYDVEPTEGNNTLQGNLIMSSFKTAFTSMLYTTTENNENPGVDLLKKIKAAVFSYAFLNKLQYDLKSVSSNPEKFKLAVALVHKRFTPLEKLLHSLYDVKKIGGGVVDTKQLKRIANEMTPYFNAMKKLIKLIYDVQETSRFGSPNSYTIDIISHSGLKALVEPEENVEYFFSKDSVWVARSNVDDYEEMLIHLSDCPKIGEIIVDGKNARSDGEATKMLLNAVYELFLNNIN